MDCKEKLKPKKTKHFSDRYIERVDRSSYLLDLLSTITPLSLVVSMIGYLDTS